MKTTRIILEEADLFKLNVGDLVNYQNNHGEIIDVSDNFLAIKFIDKTIVLNKNEHINNITQQASYETGKEIQCGLKKGVILQKTRNMALLQNTENRKMTVINLETPIKMQFPCEDHTLTSKQTKGLDYIKRTIESEKHLANYRFIEPRKIYFHSICNPGCCKNCAQNKYKIFKDNYLLGIWDSEGNLPVPNQKCENDICRCILFQIIPSHQYLDSNGDVRLRTENPKKWEKWIKKNSLSIEEPTSLLPNLDKNEEKIINDLNFTITSSNLTAGKGLINKENLTKQGYSLFNNIKNVFKSFSFDEKDYLNAYNGIFADYTKEDLNKIALNSELMIYRRLLQQYKYCLEKNISCTGLFGFTIEKTTQGDFNYIFQNNFIELNDYARLSKFDPELGSFV